MGDILARYRDKGIEQVIFGDLFLRDIRSYREERLARVGMKGVFPLFPLWGRNTSELANQFIDAGFRAVICCVDPLKLSGEFCGREYDTDFLDSIPSSVDPCGENGEFHTFVYAGLIFRDRIRVVKGEVVLREGFYFADILPGAGSHQ